MKKIFEFGKAICYSGYRDGQSPETVCPTKEQITEDLLILVDEGYKYIRMYDPNDHARFVLEVIREKKLPLKCLLGVDSFAEASNEHSAVGPLSFTDEQIAANIKRNDNEYEKLIALVKEFDDEVIAVSIGNENTPEWGTRLVSEARLIEHADRLHEALDKPVTFCEGAFEWMKLDELAKHLDFISVHNYPMHARILLEDAIPENKRAYKEVSEKYPDKEVIFTEVGWTVKISSHMIEGQGSVENQKTYITALNKWLEEEQIIAFIFEAFDETWKAETPDKGECNWGLHYMDRTKKW
ncbi:MAG: glycosyl hydrolase [Clostridia bacterium]|nr:glycosyl hydrolase [Clostridia bacterium]